MSREWLRIRIQERTNWKYIEPFEVVRVGKFIPLIYSSPTHLAFENDGNTLLTSIIQERKRAKANHHISIKKVKSHPPHKTERTKNLPNASCLRACMARYRLQTLIRCPEVSNPSSISSPMSLSWNMPRDCSSYTLVERTLFLKKGASKEWIQTWFLNKPHRNRIYTSVIGSDRIKLWVTGKRTNTDIHHHDVKNSNKKR